jgi:hypothetical protein
MKSILLLSLAFLACVSGAPAQTGPNIKQSEKIVYGTNPPSGLFPQMATLTRGIVDSSGRLVMYGGSTALELLFPGANKTDGYEITLTVTEPTADRAQVIPDVAGTYVIAASEVVTAANVITAGENNSTFYLSSETEFASTLPAPFLGARYTFIVAAAPSGANYTIVPTGSGAGNDIVKGQAHITADAAGDAGTADDTISFVSAQSVAGDMVQVWSDGTSWFAHAFAAVAAGVTFTDAD